MDPNKNLAEQRRLIKRLTDDGRVGKPQRSAEEVIADGFRLAELAQALDEWITGRGFKPSDWV